MIFTTNNNPSNTIYAHTAIAQKISWEPIKNNGEPLTNMILKSIEGSLEFHLNILSRFLYFMFIVFGLIFTFYATYSLLSYHFEATLWSVILGFTLIGTGIYMFSKQAIPLIFDKDKNVYFKKNENLEKEDETALNDIHALQVISYTQEHEGKKEQQAELNLVLNNGERVYVCSYDSDESDRVKEDAAKISKYIDKPVWSDYTI